MSKLLTKSNFLNGLVADALLWRMVNDPDSMPEPDDFQREIFESGKVVGILAQQYFKEGIDLSSLEFKENIEATQHALDKRQPVFEAGFIFDRYYVRVDILEPTENNKWNIVEVKSSTKVKDIHVHDLTFQKFVLQLCGIEVDKTRVMLLNKHYVRGDVLIVNDLFRLEDISEKVDAFLPDVQTKAARMLDIMDLPECPPYTIDDYTGGKHPNIFEDEFKGDLPQGSIFELYRGGVKKLKLLWKEGTRLLKDYPVSSKTSDPHRIQVEVAQTQKPHIEKENIQKFLNGLEYPIYHLDFETFVPAIPVFKGTTPYMQIPFQYSLHVEHENGELEHREYLHTDNNDPRKPLFERLYQEIGSQGTILAFNADFEMKRLKEMVDLLPEYNEWIQGVLGRFKDLIEPFQKFYYYNPDQQGSCSIKEVLPVMSDLSYENMPISNGGDAMSTYNKYFVKNEVHENKEQLIKDMLDYCKQDTFAMVLILQRLRELVKV